MEFENNPAWTPESWKNKPISQPIVYSDKEKTAKILNKLKSLPPLVSPFEIDQLRLQLAEVAENKRFLLQGGDCAETFDYCSQLPIENKLKVLLQMSLILVWGGRLPVVRVARLAGQYGKPRSSPTEVVDGKTVASFRGENINGMELSEREPDPERMEKAYFHSSATLNYVRTLLNSNFADLHYPSTWNLNHIRNPILRQEYESITQRLLDSLDFMKVIGMDPSDNGCMNKSNGNESTRTVDFFVSHEGLHLEFETSMTREAPNSKGFYNLGTHFLWIGDRTRELSGAHIEYFRGIRNPIGVKVGPTMEPQELVRLLRILDPNREPGRVTLITRFGAKQVETFLPSHIKAVQRAGLNPIWVCDPMHGNTRMAPNSSLKTRHFKDIVDELSSTLMIHKQQGSHLGGVHFELTGDPNITECLGGSMELTDISTNYQTLCDPRLNYEQSIDMAFIIAKYLEKERLSHSFPDR